MNRKTIAIDFDGVIAETDIAKVNFARNELGLDVTQSSMKERYFMKLFGEDRGRKLYSHIIKSVYFSEQMLKVPRMPFSREGISNLCEAGWTCVVITSRSGSADEQDSPAYWSWRYLQEHAYKIEKENFIGVNENSKLDACLARNSRGLIDDDYSKILPIIDAGLKGYLFSTETNALAEQEYPIFQGIRVNDWKHLTEILLKNQ